MVRPSSSQLQRCVRGPLLILFLVAVLAHSSWRYLAGEPASRLTHAESRTLSPPPPPARAPMSPPPPQPQPPAACPPPAAAVVAEAPRSSPDGDCGALVEAAAARWWACPPLYHGRRCGLQYATLLHHAPPDAALFHRCRTHFAAFSRQLARALLERAPGRVDFHMDGGGQALTIGKGILAVLAGQYWAATGGHKLPMPSRERYRWAGLLSSSWCTGDLSFYCLFDFVKPTDLPPPQATARAVSDRAGDASLHSHVVQAFFVGALAGTLQASNVTADMLRRHERVQPRAAEFDDEMSLSMHVRHGDACNVPVTIEGPRDGWKDLHKRPCYPWPVYQFMLLQMHDTYGVCRVFLGTDDAALAVTALADRRFEWHTIEADRSALQTQSWIDLRQNTASETVSGVLDAELLARGDILIGSFSSHFTRLAYYRIMGRLGYIPPFAAVDGYSPVSHIDYPSDAVSLMRPNHTYSLRTYIARYSGLCCGAGKLFPGSGLENL